MNRVETEVLVVGAGPSGATAALLLGRHGVDTLMLSKDRWVADSPRAHIVNQRTMEVMRSVGLEEACYREATAGELMANHVMMTAIAGQEFGRMWSWGNDPARAGEYAAASPGHGCDLPQDRLEPILVGEAARLGVKTRFDTRFLRLEQDDEAVISVLEDRVTGEHFEVRSRYVIGADGGRSPVAEAIELPLTGKSGLAPALNVHFTADLSRYVAHRPGSLYWILQPDREGALGNAMLRMVRPWHEWQVGFVHLGAAVADLSVEEVENHVKDLIQDDSIKVTVNGVYSWQINQVIAERYSKGRVFCAGDAVHRHPPMNGLGGNTCIQDAFNLIWKIAAVLRWKAGTQLLETYSVERQPVGAQVVDRAVQSWKQNPEVIQALGIEPNAEPEVRRAQFNELFADTDAGEQRRTAFERAKRAKAYSYHAHGVEMNQVYSSRAVVDDSETPMRYERDPELYYQESSRPGARLPHCWVEYQGHTCSTLDLVRPEQFTLLTRSRGGLWLDAVAELADDLPFEVTALRIGIGPECEVADLYDEWAIVSEIGETGCLLVRPDQHVAWRCARHDGDAVATLSRILGECLAW